MACIAKFGTSRTPSPTGTFHKNQDVEEAVPYDGMRQDVEDAVSYDGMKRHVTPVDSRAKFTTHDRVADSHRYVKLF